MCEKTTDDAAESEVTPEMIEAGLDILWGYIERPFGDEMRRRVREIYLEMKRARRLLR